MDNTVNPTDNKYIKYKAKYIGLKKSQVTTSALEIKKKKYIVNDIEIIEDLVPYDFESKITTSV